MDTGFTPYLNPPATVLLLKVLGGRAEARGGAAPAHAIPGEQQRRIRAYEGEVVLQDAVAEREQGLAGGHVERELQPALDVARLTGGGCSA
jgi:hypothetical protein